jgi:hypothetical protein
VLRYGFNETSPSVKIWDDNDVPKTQQVPTHYSYSLSIFTTTMNTKFLAFLLSCVLAASCSSAFVVTKKTSSKASSTSLFGGFLDGGGNKIMSRINEDAEMWIPEPETKKPTAAQMKAKKVEPKKPVAKKAVPKKGAAAKKAPAAAFKFPWQK